MTKPMIGSPFSKPIIDIYIYLTKKEENGGRGGKNFEYEVKLSLIGCV